MAVRNRSIRAVLYLRRSTARQETSIEDQRAELVRYAKRLGYTIVAEYVDDGISGDKTELRLEFLRMREDAAGGSFDIVLCWDQDRFGRFDLLDAGKWIAPFRESGVRLETIAQGPIDWEDLVGQLIYSVNQMGKAQFLRDLSRNTVRGMLSSAKQGKAGTGGPSPFGYKSKDGEVWIIEDEAKIVRSIFAEYLKPEGSLRSIAADLNRRCIAPPRGKIWRSASIRSILLRRKYTGTFVYGNQNAGKYFCWRDGEIAPRRKSDKTIKSEPIIHENHFEPIVDQETFDKAQARLNSNQKQTAPRTGNQYVLTGLVRCGDCGGSMGGRKQRSNNVYKCLTYNQSGTTSCHCNSIKEAPLVEVIVRKIQDRYLSDEALDRLRSALKQEQERGKPRPKDLSRLRKEIESLDRKIDNGEETIFDAPPSLRAGLYHKLESLTDDRNRLKAELDALARPDKRSNGKDDEEIGKAIDALRELGEALAKARPEETKSLLASIVSKIELNYKHEETEGGRSRNTFTHGTIYVRPEAGGGRSVDPGNGNSTNMNKIGPNFE